jgi:hypothetical protein
MQIRLNPYCYYGSIKKLVNEPFYRLFIANTYLIISFLNGNINTHNEKFPNIVNPKVTIYIVSEKIIDKKILVLTNWLLKK